MNDRLTELYEKIKVCKKCGLCKTAHNKVMGSGNPEAPLMIIGEAPGAEEDRTGTPFVGKAGRFLDECLKECGLDRKDVFIANVMKCRPCIIEGRTNKNRPPSQEEIKACSPYLKEQINIIKPKIILSLGAPATKFVLGRKVLKMTEIRGIFYRTEFCEYVMPSLHPSYILTYKGEAEKRLLISDKKKCAEIISNF